MKILFIYKNSISSFMQTDIDLLGQLGEVRLLRFHDRWKPVNIFGFIRQLWILITYRPDVTFCYFGDSHCVIPALYQKLMKRISIIIVAGYDAICVNDNLMKYGVFNYWWRGWLTKIAYKHTSNILTVSNNLIWELHKNGVKTDSRFQTVYFGFDDSFTVGTKENFCLFVAYANDKTSYYRKGYDRFFMLAELLPQFEFICVGISTYTKCPSNVTIIDKLSHSEVNKLMSKAKVYVHPARIEGFGCVITEAMLSGCDIITSDANGIPENYGGHCFTQYDWDSNIQIIVKHVIALMQINGLRKGNIQTGKQFSLEKRLNEFNKIINKP